MIFPLKELKCLDLEKKKAECKKLDNLISRLVKEYCLPAKVR